MKERWQHRQIYKEIPEMKCINGCTDCCGPVPLTEYEAERLGIPDASFTPTNENGKCVFIKNGGCGVYDRRPLICRMFGTVTSERMLCPHGKKPKKMMSREKEMSIMQKYNSLKFNDNFHGALLSVLQKAASSL